jgi:hypothetical protein
MTDDPTIQSLRRMFAAWPAATAANSFPAPTTLSIELKKLIPQGKSKKGEVNLNPSIARYFATAALEIWHRAVHSLLISSAISRESELWSTVCGYYATHYTFRGLAHLLGHYQLYHLGWRAHVRFENGGFVCSFNKGASREHDWYRKIVSADLHFKADPFFSDPSPPTLFDVAHRDRANYADHLSLHPSIHLVDRETVRNRLQQIARMEVQAPPELTMEKFPSVETVQINAYQRIVRFRQFLDDTLDNNRLWSVHRNPGWATEFTDFQTVEARGAVQR